jgi:crotonobetainyl-CoA:carnitine CoA-transferase CaiB-like acyl-CoA transferase
MTNPAGLTEAQELIKRADIVIHNFPPSNSETFGLDYESVKSLKSDVIYCSITGFGSGAGAAMPGYDLLVQAMGGLMSVTGPAPGEPTKVGVALVDVITGMHATIGLLAALNHRNATGEGQQI